MTDAQTYAALGTQAAGLAPDQLPLIASGQCRALYAFDVGLAIDLAACRRLVSTGAAPDARGEQLARRRGTPSYFSYQPLPLRLRETDARIETAQHQRDGDAGAPASALPASPAVAEPAEVAITLYDFGAITVEYAWPLAGPLARLLELGRHLDGNAAIERDAQQRVRRTLERIRATVTRPELQPVVEDYVIFQVDRFETATDAQTLLRDHAALLAGILRAEQSPLFEGEVEDVLRNRLSYGPGDLVLIDWNSAFVFDQDCDDTLSVLQFANVELLEMRWLDGQLNRSLDEAYQLVNRPRSWLARLLRPYDGSIHRIAVLQVDAAVMFENVDSAIKLVGDQYLARVYRRALERFHLPEWDAGILRKLEVLRDIHQTLTDRAAATRMEALEWIIILLIAAEIVLSLKR